MSQSFIFFSNPLLWSISWKDVVHSLVSILTSLVMFKHSSTIYSFNAFCFRMSVEMEHFETIRKVLCQYMDLWNSESKKKWRILTLLRHSLWNGIGYITLYLNSLDVVTHSLEHFKSKMESSFELLWIPLLILAENFKRLVCMFCDYIIMMLEHKLTVALQQKSVCFDLTWKQRVLSTFLINWQRCLLALFLSVICNNGLRMIWPLMHSCRHKAKICTQEESFCMHSS